MTTAPFALANKRRIAAAGFCAVSLPLLTVAAALPASAAEIGQVTVPGSHGRELGCRSDWDIDCPVLTKDAETGLFTGTFDVPAGSYTYWAMATDTEGLGTFYGVDGQVGGAKYSYTTEGGPVTFIFDPANNAVTVETEQESVEPAEPEAPEGPGIQGEPQAPAPNVVLNAWWDNIPFYVFYLDIPQGADIFVGDLNSDRRDEITIKRGSEFHIRSSTTSGNANWVVRLGEENDFGLIGDWDGDDDATIGIVRR